MSGITDPGEEYFKDGLWGWVTDQWKKLVGDDAGHLQVDVVESGLPSGAATSANQATMITALQLIDDLRNALDSVATDELLTVFHSQDVDVEVTQTAAADLTPGVMGWDGSAWRKLPVLWGYSGDYVESEISDDVGAGDNSLTFSTVPAGEVWVILGFTAYANQSNPTFITFRVYDGAVTYSLVTVAYPSAFLTVSAGYTIVVPPGGHLVALFSGCSAGDDIRGRAWGYKMKVAE